MTTYGINGSGGSWPEGRWLSLEAAKARVVEDHQKRLTEAEEDGEDPPDTLEFIGSTIYPDDGDPAPWHIQVYEGCRMVACIWPDVPAWPVHESPDLVMLAQEQQEDCSHRSLVCKLAENRPLIVCSDCDTEWRPGPG